MADYVLVQNPWHSSLCALSPNCATASSIVSLLIQHSNVRHYLLACGRLLPCYQLMQNRQQITHTLDMTCRDCFISWIFPFCTECITRTALAEEHNLQHSCLSTCCKSACCLPCMIWQGFLRYLSRFVSLIFLFHPFISFILPLFRCIRN